MARTSTPTEVFADVESARQNKPQPKINEKTGKPGADKTLYEIKRTADNTVVYIWSTNPTNAAGIAMRDYTVAKAIDKPVREKLPPVVKARRAVSQLTAEDREALLAELLGQTKKAKK